MAPNLWKKVLAPEMFFWFVARTYPEGFIGAHGVQHKALTGDVDQDRSGALGANGVAGHTEILSVVSVVQTPQLELRFEAVWKAAALSFSKPGETLHRWSAVTAAPQGHRVAFRQGTLNTEQHQGATRSNCKSRRAVSL